LEQFNSIAKDESTHSTVLQGAIASFGDKPITTCTFNFSSVLTDVTTMAAVARLVENVGVSAYLGAAHLLSDPVLLTAAGSILTVEARHQTVLNILNAGTAIPQAFDVGFTPQEVLAIAGPFISGCDVGVTANPTLSVTNTGKVGAGTALTFSSAAINGTTDGFFCQMIVGGLSSAITLPFNQCVVPEGITGPVALWVTSDNQPLLNNPVDRDQSKIVAGPTMAFIDNQPQVLGQLVRAGSGASPTGTSTSTITLKPGKGSTATSSSLPQTTSMGSVSPSSGTGISTPPAYITPSDIPPASNSSDVPPANASSSGVPVGRSVRRRSFPHRQVMVNGWS